VVKRTLKIPLAIVKSTTGTSLRTLVNRAARSAS